MYRASHCSPLPARADGDPSRRFHLSSTRDPVTRFVGTDSYVAGGKGMKQTVHGPQIFKEAQRVYRILVDATGEVDNSLAVIENGQPDVLDAFKAWPRLVERWTEVQCVRQWLALVENNGFREDHPESLIRTDAQAIEQDVWRSQFGEQLGVQVSHVDPPEAALGWFAEKKIETGATA